MGGITFYAIINSFEFDSILFNFQANIPFANLSNKISDSVVQFPQAMIYLLVGMLLFLIIALMIKNHVFLDLRSFLHKGFKARRGVYGVYCFCGKQGTGKTFATVAFLLRNRDKKIYSNVHLRGIDYTYFQGFEEMLKIKEKNCIIVYDEIFTVLAKQSKINPDVLSFLSQQRKNEVIFITTAQEWMEISMTLRRYVRYQIDCMIINILPFSILIERYRDGENMKWDQLENEYVAPVISTKISKMAYKVTEAYDTWEVISGVSAGRTPAAART